MKVVYKNRQTGLYFVFDINLDTNELKTATICSSSTKWSYQFYQTYESCLYSDEVKLERRKKIKKLNEY